MDNGIASRGGCEGVLMRNSLHVIPIRSDVENIVAGISDKCNSSEA